MSYLNYSIQEITLSIPVFIKARVSRVITFFFAVFLSTSLTIGAVTVARAAADVIPNLLPTITATKADTFVGGDGDGKADPGETIRYITVISNSGTDATGVTFNDIIDANTTLVAGSVNVSPLAINDSYDTVGNTLLEVSSIAPASPTVHVAGSLFANDVEFLGDTFDGTHTHITSHSGPTNGTLTLDNNTGTFTYLPSANFTGIDSFTYTLTDLGGLTDTATVTINVLGRVWYVKNDAAAGGLGRSSDPFDTLLEAQTASSISDTIYIFQGSGITGQNAGIILKDGQHLLGEGVALTVPVSINGGSNPTTLRTAGTRPTIGNSAGDGVSLSTVSIGASFTGVEIRGLNISGTGAGSNAVDITTHSTFGGSFELAANVISMSGAEGIDINGGGSGTLTVSIHDNTITSAGNGIDIQRTAGNVTVTTFDDNIVSGSTVGSGINIVGTGTSILFDAIPGTAAFDVVSGGTTTIGQSGNGVGAAGLTLNNIRGDISFTDLDIYADSGAALFINGTSPNYTGTSGTRITANTNTPTLVASAGAAADITDTNITLVLNTLSSANSGTTGVSLTRVGGTFTAPSGSSITNATGVDFSINGGSNASANVAVTYPGTITDDVGTLVQIQNVTATSTHAFSGAITDGNDGDGSGISLTSNTGATINFTGALTLSTGANTAFNVIGGGTISATNTTSTVTTTTATAVNVASTTIGASNLTFRSVSSSGGSATGIILTSTGSTGSLVVAGDGTTTKGGNGSGGTITNKTGGADGSGSTSSGVYINNGSAILRNMTLTRFDNYGVYGLSINNVTVQYSTVGAISGAACADADGDIGTSSGSGDAALVFGITNPGGSNGFSSGVSLLLDNLRVFCSIEHQVEIYQQSGTFTATISNSDIKDASSSFGGDGVQVEMQGTANGTVTVDTISFDDNKSQAVQGAANDSSTLDMTVKNSTLVRSSQGNEGILLSNGSNGDLIAHVTGNNISGIQGANIFVGQTPGNATASSSLTAYIANNIIDHPTSAVNSAILVWTTSTVGAGAPANVMVTNNTITQNSTSGVSRGIFVDTPDAGTNPNFSVTVLSNTVHIQDNVAGLQGIVVQGRQASTACFDVRTNLVDFPNGTPAGIFGIRIRQANTATVNLEQGGSAGAPATVLAANNTATAESVGTVGVVGNSTCANPPVSFSPNRTETISQAQLKASVDTQTMISLAPVSIEKTVSNGALSSVMKHGFPARSTAANVPANPDGGKPLFALMQPAPALSGETVGPISIGTLPAGKSVTVTYNVTVDNPQPDGKTQILNQSTISGSNFSNVLTTDAGPADCVNGTKTCTPVDRPDTTASSINRQTPSTTPTNATSVVWRVTFANAVSGLTSSNFTLANTGLTAPSITAVSAVTASPDTQWDVTVNTGTGDGTLGLNLVNDTGLSHDVTNLSYTGEVYVVDKTVPTVTNVTSSTVNGYYNAPDLISIQVVFNEVVNVTGTPQLTLETGATDRVVNYTSGSGTNTLTFDYTVQAGDTSADLDYFGTSALSLNGGSIADNALNNANLTLVSPGAVNSLGANKNIVIDTTAPTVTSFIRETPSSQFTNADTLIFRVTFSEPTGYFSGLVGTDDFIVHDNTPSATTTATITAIGTVSPNGPFLVTVSGGDIATFNGNVGLDFSGSMIIMDQAGNPLANVEPSTDEIYTLDNTVPTITNVTSTSANGSYITGAVIPLTVTFSEAVTVTGTPQLTLETGTTDQVVNYTSGSGTSTLTFNYTVQAGDNSPDLDYVGTTSLALNSGTIADAATNPATLTLATPGASGSLGANKNIVIDATAPTVTNVTSTQTNGSYGTGVVIPVTVTFDEAVTVTGTPQLTLETGTTDRVVDYTSGSGTTTLTFNYTTQFGDSTPDLDYVGISSLALNGGTIADAATNAATLTLATPGAAGSLGSNKDIVIDATEPGVTNVTSTSTNGSYGTGVVIPVTVTFSEAVTVTGTPQLTLETGTTNQVVDYTSGSGTTTLTFNYTVQAGDSSLDLDYVSNTSLALNSGTIKDVATNDAVLTLPTPGAANSLGANKNIVIDTATPTVTNVTSTSANGSYTTGAVIPVTVTFDEAVTVTGTPQLTLETGTTDQVVNYTSGSGTSTLTFNYTVQAGDSSLDLDYVSATSLALNGGTIADAATNTAILTLATPGAAGSLGANKNIVIDTTAPTVINISSTSANGSYIAGNVIPLTVTFSKTVTVTGTPQLTLETGSTDQVVDYTSGSGTTALTFNYTVQAGDSSLDLDYVSTTSLALNSGTIKDVATNDAILTLPTPGASGSLGANKNIVIDTTAPTVTNVTSTQANGSYGTGVVIPVTVTFSEAVTVTGTPQLTLETGTTDQIVDYASGSGTTTLTFNYTVQTGDSSPDLDYIGTNALALNGGTIADAATNAATLTLATPGAAGSLGANKDIVIDTVAPTVTNVTSTQANGSYGTGVVIPVTVTFSEAVTVTGTPQLTLETGATDQVVDYTSGSGTTTLTFNYTVQTGDSSPDLDYIGTNALALNGGTIKDAQANNASLTLAVPGAANSLGSNKAIEIDAVAPDTSITANPTNPTNNTSANFAFTGDDGTGVGGLTSECKLDAAAYTACTSPQNYSSLLNGSHTFQVRAIDSLGNTDATPASYTWVVDTATPTVVLTSTTTSPTNASPILVTITFSEPVDIGTGVGDLSITNGTASTPVGSGTTYTFNLTPSGQGPVTAIYLASSAIDAANNSNTVSPTFSIIYDTVSPTVTINQAAGQIDPTNFSPINFTVVFDESVTGFTGAGVTLSGTAGATTAVVTGSGTTYNVAVSGMTVSGTVIASIPSAVAQDAATNDNVSSSSTDDTVAYNHDSTLPTVVSSLRANPSPTNLASVDFTVTFSESVTGVDLSDFNLTTSGVSSAALSGLSGSGSVYTVSVNTGTGSGTIRLDVANDGTIRDVALNPLGAGFTSGQSYTISKSPIFSDVPYTYWANSFIERLYNAGITTGCGTNPLIYCPDSHVTRAQMAIFLMKSIHGPSYSPPNATGTVFGDVPITYWAAAWIEQFYAEGFTSGCGNNNYCPDQTATTRAQMAIFLLKAIHGSTYTPPPATGVFNDVPTNYWAAAWIEQLIAEGITSGCGNGNYCPENSLTRAEMAVFLVKTFNLP